jgi:ERCC4-type nuclease
LTFLPLNCPYRSDVSRCVITADVFEKRSGIPQRLEALGAEVVVVALPAGDYAIGSETAVERKTVDDLHRSVLRDRFWSQIGEIRYASRYPFLLIEGADIDRGALAPAAVRGICLTAMKLGVRLLRSKDSADSALWLYRLAAQDRSFERPFGSRPTVSRSRHRRERPGPAT